MLLLPLLVLSVFVSCRGCRCWYCLYLFLAVVAVVGIVCSCFLLWLPVLVLSVFVSCCCCRFWYCLYLRFVVVAVVGIVCICFLMLLPLLVLSIVVVVVVFALRVLLLMSPLRLAAVAVRGPSLLTTPAVAEVIHLALPCLYLIHIWGMRHPFPKPHPGAAWENALVGVQ